MTKKFSIFLAMVMVVGTLALAACGNGDKTTTQPTTTEPTTTQPTTTEPTTTEPTTTEPTTTEPTTTEPTTTEPTTPPSSGDAPQLSATNHVGQTNDALCALCHPAPYPTPDDANHQGVTSGCLADGCHTLP